MATLSKIYGHILELCGLIAALLVFAMTALIVADVVLRNLSDTSIGFLRSLARHLPATIPASVELTEYAMFFAAAFAAPWLLRRGQHIRIDVVVAHVPPVAGWIMEIVCDLIGLALSLLMTWYGLAAVLRSARADTLIVKNLVFLEWYVLWPLPLMFLLISVEFAFRLQRMLTGPRQARREGGAV